MADPTSTSSSSGPSCWWGEFDVAPGETLGWRIGDLDLRVRSDVREWQVQRCTAQERLETSRDWRFVRGVELSEGEKCELDRFVFEEESGKLRVTPLLADRSVVTYPRVATHVLPGHSATLFVGTPIWVQVQVQEPPTTIVEAPARRPSDTWFGPSRMSGELCYASASAAAQNLDNVPLGGVRAVTPLRVENRADTPLRIERIKLPVGSLSLFASESGLLWTNQVVMSREGDGDTVTLDLTAEPPPVDGPLTKIRGPRNPDHEGFLSWAFLTIFQGRSTGE